MKKEFLNNKREAIENEIKLYEENRPKSDEIKELELWKAVFSSSKEVYEYLYAENEKQLEYARAYMRQNGDTKIGKHINHVLLMERANYFKKRAENQAAKLLEIEKDLVKITDGVAL